MSQQPLSPPHSVSLRASAGTLTSSAGPPHESPSSVVKKNADEEWTFAAQLKDALEARGLPATHPLTLVWDDLSIRGVGGASDVKYAPDLANYLLPFTSYRERRRLKAAIKLSKAAAETNGDAMHWLHGMKEPRKGEPGLRRGERYLIKRFTGALKPGEMMLVVGRPGSGCTTFLHSLAGQTSAYAGVEGSVHYGALEARSPAMRPLAAEVNFVSEEEQHDPQLLVGRTIDFALRMATPGSHARPLGEDGKPISAESWVKSTRKNLLRAFRISNTDRTKVGDQYTQGVSGGERRRVSLAEALATDATIQCWDNATRGLDASTALGFARTCRTLGDTGRKINVVSLYQAGNSIYALFDKVCVLAEGRCIYYGPRAEARPYFENLGFVHMDGANTADFLTAVTAVAERKIAPDFEGRVPTSPAEFAAIYAQSEVAARMRSEVDSLLADRAAREEETAVAADAERALKSKYAFKGLPQKRSFTAQIRAAVVKDAQQRWGDQWSFWARQVTTFVMAWINGSVFYQIPDTTGGIFLRNGVLFMCLLFPTILAFADVNAAFVGRSVLAKHKAYSLYRPSAVLIAQMIIDLPIYFVQIFLYTIITYFMAGLRYNAGKYWTVFLFTWVCALVFTTLFRTIGYAFNRYNDASKLSGTTFILFVTYAGFVIYSPSMHPWFAWIRWINPLFYAMEAMVSNELTDLVMQCASPQLAPYGPMYVGKPAGCAIQGATYGSTLVKGTSYLQEAMRFSRDHVWRNFGVILALWFITVMLGMGFLEWLPAEGSSQDVTLYKRGGGGALVAQAVKGTAPRDEEEGSDMAQITEKPHGDNSDLAVKEKTKVTGEMGPENQT